MSIIKSDIDENFILDGKCNIIGCDTKPIKREVYSFSKKKHENQLILKTYPFWYGDHLLQLCKKHYKFLSQNNL